MIWVVIGFSVACIAFGLWRWTKHAPRSVVGQADFAETIHETMHWAKDGGCLALKDPASGRGVAFTKRCLPAGRVAVSVGLLCESLPDEELSTFQGRLEILGIPAAPDAESNSAEWAYHFAIEGVPESEVCGRIADLAFKAVGFAAGDSFIHSFEGSLDMDAVKKYRRRRFPDGIGSA